MLTNSLIRGIETKMPNQIHDEPFHHNGFGMKVFRILRWNRYHNTAKHTNQNARDDDNTTATTIGLSPLQHGLPFIYFRKCMNGHKQEKYQPNESATTTTTPSNSLRWLFILVSRLRLIVELFHLHLFFLSKCVRSSTMCNSCAAAWNQWVMNVVGGAGAGVAIGFGILPCSWDSMDSTLNRERERKKKICWEKQKKITFT